ncbi:hypothetical protein QAD02_009072 [Eretmocerus hayati]|uniref:Uncharacterized protein n=1 Tax=Eretmocerus hayati TaxID=131215 RepID=A0ACC2N8N2_9HYME|nr:hypothetical protein QAD02_009072 [Eretmocerus hayati]
MSSSFLVVSCFDQLPDGLNVNSAALNMQTPTLYSMFDFSLVTASQATYFALAKERTARDRGLCYVLADKESPPDWNDHINDAFTMVGDFLPRKGDDFPPLRVKVSTTSSTAKDTYTQLAAWVEHFVTKKF